MTAIDVQPDIKQARMLYSAFTLENVRKQFAIEIGLQKFFTQVAPIQPTDLLQATLTRAATVILISEKARSEFIVAPILLEVKEILENTISIYSGVRLDVAPDEGLQGVCVIH